MLLRFVYVFLDYSYPSDHVCVHKDKLDDFNKLFEQNIFPHTTNNIVNHNINLGINKKICV